MGKTTKHNWIILAVGVLLGFTCATECRATIELKSTTLESERQSLRYGYASAVLIAGSPVEAYYAGATEDDLSDKPAGQKSPLKAFVLSAALPGLGQYYYGSKLKAGLFFGAEVAAWALHIKWHGDGQDQENAFEDYNHAHWSKDSYSQYLMYAYGVTDDDDVSVQEITHHLPETETQQFFEMTGKYDQFAWGWEDAQREGLGLDAFHSTYPTEEAIRITGESSTPSSAMRQVYEQMRKTSNDSFDKASKMIIASIANRVLSAFEAYFTTQHQNNTRRYPADEFGQRDDDNGEFKFNASLKSYHSHRDTPYLKVTYKF